MSALSGIMAAVDKESGQRVAIPVDKISIIRETPQLDRAGEIVKDGSGQPVLEGVTVYTEDGEAVLIDARMDSVLAVLAEITGGRKL